MTRPLVLWLLATCTVVQAQQPARVDYQRDIRPIFANNCFACHGPDEAQREAGFRLDRRDGAFGESDSGARPIVPGDVDASEVIARITSDDPSMRMPPEETNRQLTPEEIDRIRLWIEQGAEWKEHWSLVPPERPEVPTVKRDDWPVNPIDAFILKRLEEEGLEPSPPASKETLLRRVTFDLTGLPPTLDEIDAFLSDTSPGAYERVVDRLLNSPAYGEHMARYWLDAARYGDTHGLHLDNYREMWAYRDWVIRAMNANMPYDEFLRDQLAGDLLPNPTLDQLVATGFLRCHVTTNEGGSIVEEVYVRNVVDRVVTTGTVFMGLTFDCTRCHDHKFDPLTMRDFYSMFAFFNSLDGSEMDGNAKDPPPIVHVPTDAQQEQLAQLTAERDALRAEIEQALRHFEYHDPAAKDLATAAERTSGDEGVKAEASGETPPAADVAANDAASTEGTSGEAASGDVAQGQASGETEYDSLAAWESDQRKAEGKSLPEPIRKILLAEPAQRSTEDQQQLRDYFIRHVYRGAKETFTPLNQKLAALDEEIKKLRESFPSTLIFRERSEPREAYVLNRGEYDQRREQVQRATPAALPPMPEGASMDRLGLAQWLLDPQHPLTARVAVNRLWQQVFGTGLVKTSEDFGSQGEPPSHPELLDWLAVHFRESGWDVKALMKMFVMSSTYRQSSRVTEDLRRRDPENRLLARGPRFRLDAEALRDQALAVSGLLVRQIGGPSVKPPQPPGLWFAVGYSGSNTVRFTPDKGPDKVHRRTLYTFIKRTAPPPQLSTFDAPSREACTMRRERTNTPLQALLLMNDPQYVEAARALAERVMRERSEDAERAHMMFRLCTARLPDDEELAEILGVYRDHLAAYQEDEAKAEALINVGEVPPDGSQPAAELAAWTMVANLMLNLDEVVTKN